MKAPVAFLARLLMAHFFLIEGWGKIGNAAAVAAFMESRDIPGALLPLVIITELAGGAMVALGFLARPAAFVLAGFCVLAALVFHSDFDVYDQLLHFHKNLVIAGGFLMIVAFGPGAWSLDAIRARRA